jgi:hypothetical protein
LAITPQNLVCILLSLGKGIAAVSPLRKALQALDAIPKLIPLILVASVC